MAPESGAADLRAEHIWLLPEIGGASPYGGDDGLGGYMPLAVVVPTGGSTAIHWVQGNHLGTPVAVTDASGAVVTPSGYSLAGFPGQVRQHAELYYNYYRDYDVSLGRYVQADPIGLEGDVNPYLYAGANPLATIDPDGLKQSPDPADVAWKAGAKHFGRNLVRPSRKLPVIGQALLIGDALGTLGAVAWYGYINPPVRCRSDDDRGNGRGGGGSYGGGHGDDDGSDRCEVAHANDEFACRQEWSALSTRGLAVCNKTAFVRYSECLARGGNPNASTTPLYLPYGRRRKFGK